MTGSSFDDFLDEIGMLEEVEATAKARVEAFVRERRIELSPAAFDEVIAALDAPAEPCPEIVALARSKAPWDRDPLPAHVPLRTVVEFTSPHDPRYWKC